LPSEFCTGIIYISKAQKYIDSLGVKVGVGVYPLSYFSAYSYFLPSEFCTGIIYISKAQKYIDSLGVKVGVGVYHLKTNQAKMIVDNKTPANRLIGGGFVETRVFILTSWSCDERR
jgi:hypothetical protein